jgi:hypothetical protein
LQIDEEVRAAASLSQAKRLWSMSPEGKGADVHDDAVFGALARYLLTLRCLRLTDLSLNLEAHGGASPSVASSLMRATWMNYHRNYAAAEEHIKVATHSLRDASHLTAPMSCMMVNRHYWQAKMVAMRVVCWMP